jgi:hypothetical protein
VIIKYNTEQLNRIIKDIYDITGITISVLDTKYNVMARCKKVQDYCYINKTPVPEITEYLKNESPVLLNEYGSPERRS